MRGQSTQQSIVSSALRIGEGCERGHGYAHCYAMRSSGITLTDEQLRRYSAEPQKTVPNMRMSFVGLKHPKDAEDVIAHLNTLG